MVKKYKDILIVTLIYTIIALIFTWPIILHLKSYIYAQSGDPFGALYSFWWSISHQMNFNFPSASLATLLPQLGSRAMGEIATYNIFTILGFVLTGLAGYILVNKITKNNLAGFFSGLILVIAPFRIAQTMQHFTFADLSLLLFFIYFLFLSWKKADFKNIFLSAVFLVLVTLYNYQYGFFAGVVLSVFFIWLFLRWAIVNKLSVTQFNYKIIYYILVSLIFSVAVIGFFNYSVFKDAFLFNNNEKATVAPTRNWSELSVYSAHSFYYYLPSPENPIFGKYTKPAYDNLINRKGTNLTEQTLYLGWVALGLTIYGLLFRVLRKIKKEPYPSELDPYISFFTLLGLAGLYFSFAPIIDIFGYEFKTPAYYIFPHFPFFRVYARFGLLMMISVSMLAGIGLTELLGKIKLKRWMWLVFVALCIFSTAEFINIPPVRTIDVSERAMPGAYQYLKNQPQGLVAEYPFLPSEEPKSYDYLLWQRYHKFPLLYGTPVNSISDGVRKTILNPEDEETINKLKEINVKYVIVHERLFTLENAKKYPEEYNNGIIPQIKSSKAKLIWHDNEDLLFVLN